MKIIRDADYSAVIRDIRTSSIFARTIYPPMRDASSSRREKYLSFFLFFFFVRCDESKGKHNGRVQLTEYGARHNLSFAVRLASVLARLYCNVPPPFIAVQVDYVHNVAAVIARPGVIKATQCGARVFTTEIRPSRQRESAPPPRISRFRESVCESSCARS